ncbi:MAG: hypothetical protein ABIX46_14285 [Burkholderiaceae bacterium]
MTAVRGTAPARWRRLLGVLAVTALVATARAADDTDFPRLDFACPGALAVRAEPGGPVFINAERATLKRYSARYYEARGSSATVAIEVRPDGSAALSTIGPNRARALCRSAVAGAGPSIAAAAVPARATLVTAAAASAASLDPATAAVRLPRLHHACPGRHEVRAAEGGPVTIDGRPARLRRLGARAVLASSRGIEVTIRWPVGRTVAVATSGRGAASGACRAVAPGKTADKPSRAVKPSRS